MSLPPAPNDTLTVVCLAVGEMDGQVNRYVERLHGMLRRHCPRPFELVCFSDRARSLPAGVQLRRCDGWQELRREGMRPTTLKLGLFNPAYAPWAHFLYLDLTLVIRGDMAALLRGAEAAARDLVIVDDWHHAGFNSSVMAIRNRGLEVIYQAFVRGERFEQRVPGDQDFINGVIAAHGLQGRVATFAPGQVESFKRLMRLSRTEPAAARAAFRGATVVKFHGKPRMQDVFAPWGYWWRVRLKELAHGRLRPVLPVAELKREWVDAAAG